MKPRGSLLGIEAGRVCLNGIIRLIAVWLTAGFLFARAQAPTGAVIKLTSVSGGVSWNVPATIEMVVTGQGKSTFTGSSGKPERGSPLFSSEVESGATFYSCDTVTGFPPRSDGTSPPINRRGGSSFIAVKTAADGSRKVWINASVGAYKLTLAGDRQIISDWEYQVRYFSGDPSAGKPATLVIGTVPNANFFGGVPAVASEASLRMPELPDLAGDIGERLLFPGGFVPGSFGTISVLVTNLGPARATGPVSVAFYLSADALLDRSVDLPLSFLTVSDIDLPVAGSRVISSDPVRIPQTLPPDGFYFLAQLDTSASLAETTKTNNVAISVAPGPDLHVISWTGSFPGGFGPGMGGQLKATIENRGFGGARGEVVSAVYLSEDETVSPTSDWVMEFSQTNSVSLNPGGTIDVAWNNIRVPTNTPPGAYSILIRVDDGNAMREQVETNNVFLTLRVSVPGNDVVGGVRLVTNAVERLHMPGDLRTASISITNRGTDPLRTPISVEVFLSADKKLDAGSDLLLYERRDQPLELAVNSALTLDIPVRLESGPEAPLDRSGPRYFIIRLNGDAKLIESVRGNNEVASEEFLMGYNVITVATHGFNPTPLTLAMWEEFRANWHRMGKEFSEMPKPGSFLYGKTRSLVPEWESSAFFLPAFGSLFAAKICDAAGDNAGAERRFEDAADWYLKSTALKENAGRLGSGSRKLAEGAAYQIVGQLIADKFLLQEPALSRGYQHLHLVGHSRGGAVNARVTKLLHGLGYRVDEYTCLDGFATDWPDDAGRIGDFDITADAGTAIVRRSYRVQRDLVNWVLDGLRINHPAALGFADAIIDGMRKLNRFLPAFVDLRAVDLLPDPGTVLALKKFDIRAPARPGGFLNAELIEPGAGSAHTTITLGYLNNPVYFHANFVGENQNNSRPPSPSLHRENDFDPESPWRLHAAAEGANRGSRGFQDGDFSETAALQARAARAAAKSSGNRFVDAWLAMTADPRTLLGTAWSLGGLVGMSEENGNPGATMEQAPDSRLGQDLVVEAAGAVAAFDLKVVAAGNGDALEILWKDEIVRRLPLLPGDRFERIQVNLGNRIGFGHFSIIMAGPAETPARVLLDNFVLQEPTQGVLRLAIAGADASQLLLDLEASAGSSVVLERSADLVAWVSERTVVMPAGGKSTIEITRVSGSPRSFYRLRREVAGIAAQGSAR